MTDTSASALKLARALIKAVQTHALTAGRRVADFLVPPACVSCRTPLAAHNTLCPTCWLQVDFIRPPLCDRLGIPLPYGLEEPMISARAAADPPVYGRARAVAIHGGQMRELAHRLKYGDQQHVVPLLARLLQEAGRDLLTDCHLLVPIPLGRARLWQRGFNQAAVLAGALSKRCDVPHDPMLLERRKETSSQVGLTREQRKDNVRGAFQVADGRNLELKGRNVLVIDDVITTGATVEAAARVLKRAGAARVDVLSLTLVTDDGNLWRRD
jgi:ComF family protein